VAEPSKAADALDLELVSALVAERACEMMQPARALAPLVVAPGHVLARLDVVVPKLADTAATDGADPRAWSQWIACVAAAGDDPCAAASRLLEHEAAGLACWCFDRARLDLGVAAYEAYLASQVALGDDDDATELYLLRTGLDAFDVTLYVDAALKLGAHGGARRALEAASGLAAFGRTEEVLLATLRFLDGALDAAGLRAAADAHAAGPSYDDLLFAARAIALQALGDGAAAREVASKIDASRVRAPTMRRVLSARFGEVFDAAVARADRKREAKRRRVEGFVLARSRAKTPHVFAPRAPPGPPCPACGHAIRTWFSLTIARVPELASRFARWPALPIPACLDCGAWMARHDYELADDGRFTLSSAEPTASRRVFDDYAAADVAPQYARLVKATSALAERPLEGDCQLGGAPAWIQDPLEVACAGCGAPMTFVFRFSAPNPFEGCPPVAGESGALYYLACVACSRLTHVAQWT
jgi:hypothetical protein